MRVLGIALRLLSPSKSLPLTLFVGIALLAMTLTSSDSVTRSGSEERALQVYDGSVLTYGDDHLVRRKRDFGTLGTIGLSVASGLIVSCCKLV
jgi:hypothetical protein